MFAKNGIKPGEKATSVVFAGKGLKGIAAAEMRALGIFGLPSRMIAYPDDPPCDSDNILAYAMAVYISRKYKYDNYESKVTGAKIEKDEKPAKQPGKLKGFVGKLFGRE
jgi:hypothetical protein